MLASAAPARLRWGMERAQRLLLVTLVCKYKTDSRKRSGRLVKALPPLLSLSFSLPLPLPLHASENNPGTAHIWKPEHGKGAPNPDLCTTAFTRVCRPQSLAGGGRYSIFYAQQIISQIPSQMSVISRITFVDYFPSSCVSYLLFFYLMSSQPFDTNKACRLSRLNECLRQWRRLRAEKARVLFLL